MIRHLTHNQIDKVRWDESIRLSKNSILYGYSWYLDIVSPNWEALVLSDYEAIFPLCVRKKFGFHYLYQPSFTQQLGIFSKKEDDEILNARFLTAIPKKFKLVEINLNISNKLPNNFDYGNNSGITHHLNLSLEYEKIASNYSENLTRNLRKASKNDFEHIKTPNPSDIFELFRKNRGKNIKNIGIEQFSVLEKLILACKERIKINLLAIKLKDEKITAGIIIPENINESIFLFSAVSEKGKKYGAMPYLIDYYIKENAGKKLQFDFEGSNDKNIARFYRGFGSKEYVYLQLKKNELPFYIRWLKN